MFKRIIALALCVLLMAAALPVGVSALTEEEQTIYGQINRDYARALEASDKESLGGYCGLFASYQLYYRGINTWLKTADGNDHYDVYTAEEMTDGGYRHKDYSHLNFSMEEALNAASRNGTRDVYNILVCFEWTSTEAGAKYGHVVFVYAILDGMVYFTESFASPMNYTAGAPTKISIADFVDYYDDWTRFEGLVVFGKKDFIDNCTEYSTNLFVETTEDTELVSQPCSVHSTEADCVLLRQVACGERLHATALYENPAGQYYYRISDGEQTGYVLADRVSVLRVNFEDVTLSEPVAPEALELGKDFSMDGDVSAPYSGINAVCVEVLDESGQMVLGYSQATQGSACNLDDGGFNKVTDFSTLAEGYYTYSVYADSVNQYLMDDGTIFGYANRCCLLSTTFRVGNVPAREQNVQTAQARQLVNGWNYEQGIWYYFENDLPRTGWFYCNGVDYYLKEDGSVTTGWAEVNGKLRYFTATGAMRTGWLETQEGKFYLMSNGAMAHGWYTVDGKLYFFREDGTLHESGWVDMDGQRYYLQPDGSAATGWVTLEEGTYCFHGDGHLLAQQVEENGKKLIRAYGDTVTAEADTNALGNT